MGRWPSSRGGPNPASDRLCDRGRGLREKMCLKRHTILARNGFMEGVSGLVGTARFVEPANHPGDDWRRACFGVMARRTRGCVGLGFVLALQRLCSGPLYILGHVTPPRSHIGKQRWGWIWGQVKGEAVAWVCPENIRWTLPGGEARARARHPGLTRRTPRPA